ncbi:MAG TPA: formyltransferase family protein [Chloroflexota bacterium]|nr:formyltransferase family protein [Chloroflexota bacterium]
MRRVVFLGMDGRFSAPPLLALLGSEFSVAGVVVPRPVGVAAAPVARFLPPPPRPRRALVVSSEAPSAGATALAWAAGVPVLEVATLSHPAARTALAGMRPDILCVACFPSRVPQTILNQAPLGGVNLHPSLLPAYRGPEPLFWLFHDGLERAGVTVHRMSSQIDRGPIVAQEAVSLPDGLSYQAAEDRCAEEGGRLLLAALRWIATDPEAGQPQQGIGSSAPLPRESDFHLTPDWPARRAFNFLRGMVDWGEPLILAAQGRHYRIARARAFDELGTQSELIRWEGREARVRCSPGILYLEMIGALG